MTTLIERAGAALKAHGVAYIESRFPYTYHHDLVRCGAYPSRSDVAAQVEKLRGVLGDEVVEAALVLGALAKICTAAPVPFLRAMAAPTSALVAVVQECLRIWDANETLIRKGSGGLWAEDAFEVLH